MPAKATGSVRWKDDKWIARVTVAKKRVGLHLATCIYKKDEKKAVERAELLATLASQLVLAGHASVAPSLLERAAARDGKALADVVEAVRRVCAGEVAAVTAQVTFGEFAEQWTSGKLAKRHPDHVREGDRKHDAARLSTYVLPLVGGVPLRDFTIDHADAVMAAIPETLSRATRRHVAQVMGRVLALAAFPGRVIATSPLPKGYLPQLGGRKAMTFLYPDEDAKLLATTTIDLAHRVLYGFLAREGMRRSEAGSLTWGDLDLDRGAVRLDVNKTDDPRAWALDPSVVRALRAFRALRGEPGSSVVVFEGVHGLVEDRGGEIVETFRSHLGEAKVTRPELFERSDVRQPIRLHDLRATFVTVSLANGKSETWVADRTGHRSSVMINRYRRAARQFAELDLGTLVPLDVAVPELRSSQASIAADVGRDVGRTSESDSSGSLSNTPDSLEKLAMPKGGIEPPTRGFSIPCSTN